MRHRALAALLVVLAACRAQESPPAPGASTAPGPTAPVVSSPPPVSSASTAAAAGGSTAPPPPTSGSSGARTWSFDADVAGSLPAGFAFGRTGDGREGRWVVRAEPGAPSGANVLAQTDADTTDNRFPVAFANEPLLKDLDLSVRCKPVSGSVDAACGMVFRLKDVNNYYITRANALENNVRLYYVKDGKRHQIASYGGKVASGAWHAYRVVAKGDRFEVYWDGAKVIEHSDKTFGDAGKVGLWTKADSVTYFDDLAVKPLE